MSSRTDQKRATRARLVAAAWARFRADGYAATTLAAVAEDAGVAVGTVCAHFPDKAALVAGAFHDELAGVVADAWATLPRHGPDAQLAHLAGRLYAWYADNPAGLDIVRESLFATGPAAGPLSDQLRAFLDAITGLLDTARARGELAPDTPSAVLAQGFFADYLLVLIGGLRGELGPVEAWRRSLSALTQARLRGFRVAPPPADRPPRASSWTPEWD
jgi:AcrR family transcriptional regulator